MYHAGTVTFTSMTPQTHIAKQSGMQTEHHMYTEEDKYCGGREGGME